MMKKLKPCPFCGSEIKERIGFGGLRFFGCRKCGALVSFDNNRCNHNPDSTYDYWNRRVDERGEDG